MFGNVTVLIRVEFMGVRFVFLSGQNHLLERSV